MPSTKRRRPRRGSPDYSTGGELQKSNQYSHIPESLLIEAHEVTIIRNRPDLVQAVKEHGVEGKRGGLIRLNVDVAEKNRAIWVDRYA